MVPVINILLAIIMPLNLTSLPVIVTVPFGAYIIPLKSNFLFAIMLISPFSEVRITGFLVTN